VSGSGQKFQALLLYIIANNNKKDRKDLVTVIQPLSFKYPIVFNEDFQKLNCRTNNHARERKKIYR
jgi:hypothetical protein